MFNNNYFNIVILTLLMFFCFGVTGVVNVKIYSQENFLLLCLNFIKTMLILFKQRCTLVSTLSCMCAGLIMENQ